jgi:hypothetical protein
MKTVFILLISLFFLVLAGPGYAHDSAQYQKAVLSTALNVDHLQCVKCLVADQEHAVIKDNASAEESEYPADVDDEDENYSRISARKYVLLFNYFITLSCAFLLSCLYNFIKHRLPQVGYLVSSSSYKYITQRVLRL